jgi:hypothetical protein
MCLTIPLSRLLFKSWVFPGRNTILKPSVARGEARVGASEDSGFTSTSRVEKRETPGLQVWRRSIRRSRPFKKFLSQFQSIWGNSQHSFKVDVLWTK